MDVQEALGRTDGRRLLVPVLVGAAVSVALGVFAKQHTPEAVGWTLGFDDPLDMKAWLTTVVALLALVQLVTALRMYRRLGSRPPTIRQTLTHRISGVLAVLVSLPVAYHCLWASGFGDYDTRVLVHSVTGCMFYGAFVAKMLALKTSRLPGWTIPVLGGLVFASIMVLWFGAALWWFTQDGGGPY